MVSLKLDFQNGIGEASDILGWELLEWPIDSNILTLPVVASASPAIVVLTNECKLCVERDTDTGVVGQLEGCAAVESSDGWTHPLGDDACLNFVGQLLHQLHVLDGLLTTSTELGELDIHGVFSGEVWVDILCLDGETFLDTLLSGPLFTVNLSLQETLGSRRWSGTVPTVV